MTKLVTITAFAVVLVLGGCQYEGTNDLSNLLKPGERIVITKETIGDTPEPETEAKSNYYTVVYKGSVPREDRDEYKRPDNSKYSYNEHGFAPDYGTFLANSPDFSTLSEIYGREPVKVEVDGKLELFIEYNSNGDEFYVATGGRITPHSDSSIILMPKGVWGYSGKVVAKDFASDAISDFRTGTVNSEVDFDNNLVSVEFNDTGINDLDGLRFENIRYDPQYNRMRVTGLYNKNTGVHTVWGNKKNICLPDCGDYLSYEVKGGLYGYSGRIMNGSFLLEDASRGAFVAERSNTPVGTN